jgi:hypothetical protein
MSAFSVCIPRIFNNIPNKKIVGTFEKLNMGKVKNMDIVWKTGRDGSSYKMAFVHFSAWNIQNSAARHFREQVEDPNVNAKLVYDDPWYWLVLPNNSNTIINSYKNRVENFIPDNAINGVSEWVQNKIAELEDELNCVYEELYQREYIPVKYRSECEWNQDIETGSINDDYMGNMSPMTIDELNCSIVNAPTYNNTSYSANVSPMTIDELSYPFNYYHSLDNTTYDDNDNATNDDVIIELHKPPSKYAKIYPEKDDLYYNKIDNNNKIVINNSEVALNEDKRWMTANYCGNN